jgi:uncharacterized protein (DUF433 family)
VATDVSKATDLIVSDPELMGGIPVFKGTRVPIKNMIDYIKGGHSIDDFLEAFPTVERKQANAVLDLATQLLLSQAA